ncbi:MAG: hypothetical protein U0892_16250 [Pirellulales bacterium]
MHRHLQTSKRAGLRLPRTRRRSRLTGAMLALEAMSLMAIMLLSAYAVNSAYMELSRSELRLANDAAAKAAITSLGQTQSVTSARVTAAT